MNQKKLTRQVIVLWEIPEERIEIEKDGKKINLPRGTSKTYTNSLSEKSHLFKDLNNWRGRTFNEKELAGFDLFTIVRANCLLQVQNKEVEREGGKKNISFVSGLLALPKGVQKKEPENKIVTYSIMDNGKAIPEILPDWIKEKIGKSIEITAINNAANNPELAKAQAEYSVDVTQQVDDLLDNQETEAEDLPF